MREISKIVLLLLCIIQTFPGPEEDKIVTAEIFLSRDKIRPGDILKTAVQVKIKRGWHILANKVADEFLIPTEVAFEEHKFTEVLELVYPKPKLGKYEYSETELEVFEGDFFIGALIQPALEIPIGTLDLKVRLRYQACNERGCLPPKTIDLQIGIAVVEHLQETDEINSDIFAKLEFKRAKVR